MEIGIALRWLVGSFVYVIAGLVMMFFCKGVLSRVSSFGVDEELGKRDNPAFGLVFTAYLLAVLIVFLGAATGEVSEDPLPMGIFLQVLAIDMGYALLGIVLLGVSRWVVDRWILHAFSVRKEILEDRNVGTGAVEAGCLIASALVIAGAIHGEGNLWTTVVYYLCGLVALVLFGVIYQWSTPYDIHHEIAEDNAPVGIAFGCSMAAIGVLLLKATYGDFVGWFEGLTQLAYYAVAGFVSLLILKRLVDWWIFPNTTLHDEIVRDRNLNAALLEGGMAIGLATSVFFLF